MHVIKRHHYMKDVNIFIPEPGNTCAAFAVSALARAMKEMNKVAILRCVWRQHQRNAVVGVLTPKISEKDGTVGFCTCFGSLASNFFSILCFWCLFWVCYPIKIACWFVGQPDSFYYNVLPFAEDVREFQSPSFSNFPASWLPNEQQQEITL